MFEFHRLDKLSTMRGYCRIILFVSKWLMRLLSATAEAYLHCNFGCRYLPMLSGGLFFYGICSGFAARPGFLAHLFFLGLIALVISHTVHIFRRRRLSAAEPHSFSAGDPLDFWQGFGFSQKTVRLYLEPAACCIVGMLVSTQDPFLGFWLIASAVSLFIKQLLFRFTTTRRVLDSIDARLEAQGLNTALKQQQQSPGQGAQRSHRAHLARSGHHPHP